jgi:ribosomal protein S18 acetylase RimI-like enzyme
LKYLDSNIIKILKKNELYFCKNWDSVIWDFNDEFFTLYNKDLFDDYFINRTIIKKNTNLLLKNKNQIEKIIHSLNNISKNEKINFYLHLNSDQTLLENYLVKKGFEKIDEVIGLYYPSYFDLSVLTENFNPSENYSNLSKIIVIDDIDTLKEWVNIYCLSFGISSRKQYLIYEILKKKLGIFYFISSKINGINETHGNTAGCCILFPYRCSISLYCLGTKKEYRHKHVATNLIDFSIKFGKEKGYQIFGLQTLKSDDLLNFYEKKGFVKLYTTLIYQL